MNSRRYSSIDMMRALAIVGMVLCHFVIDWSVPEKDPVIFFAGDHLIGDWPAAFFTFLVGVSLAISLSRRKARGDDPALIRARGVKRGLFVIALGLVLAVFTLGPASIFAWDILALTGAALILIQLIRDVRPAWIATGCIGVILLTPALRDACNYLGSWGGAVRPDAVVTPLIPDILMNTAAYYTPGFGLDAVAGFFVTGYFPFFPWIIFPLMGYLAGQVLFTDRPCRIPDPTVPWNLGLFCILLGTLTGCAGAIRASPGMAGELIAPFSFYPDTTAMLLVQSGLALCVLTVLIRIVDGKERAPWEQIPERLSRYALTLYITHLLIIYGTIEILFFINPLATPVLPSLSPATGLGLGVLFLAGFTLLTGYWDRINGRYSLEWIMAKVIGD